MKRIEIAAYGEPEEVARCVDVPEPGAPDAGEVLLEVLAFPVNPADLSFCRGRYRLKPPLPATPGAECVGRVLAVGAGVNHVRRGDLVINLARENWAQQRLVGGEDVIAVPSGIDLLQAAMIRINPPTARLLLSDVVDIAPGGFVIQNVANSAVGRLLIQFARERGLCTVNVVRRPDVVHELTALGADICLVDGPNLPQAVRAATDGASVEFGIDAVSGQATARIAACVADGGTVCNYGSMSREDPVVGSGDLVYRGVKLVGFMLGRFLARRSPDSIRALYREIAAQVVEGSIRVPIGRVYPIEEIGAALVHAQTPGHDGKILVAPNGMV
jgi:NADPH:quinone reductase-like Zn-dependent oxidoreductase